MKKIRRKLITFFCLSIAILAVLAIAINLYINLQSKPCVFQDMNDFPETEEPFVFDKDKKMEDVALNNNKEKNKEVAKKDIKEEFIKEKNILLNVPFSSQAPYGNWDDPRKQDGCEEVAVIMAMAWVREKKLDLKYVDSEIDLISAYEEEIIGNYYDTSAQDTAQIIFKGFYKYDNIEVRYDIAKEDIKQELFKGNLVIVPTNGQLLGNPFYTPPGPITHNLVIIGYDILKKEFIVNDPGTRRGEKYQYNENVLENALLDYPTGFHENIEEIMTVMIVVKK